MKKYNDAFFLVSLKDYSFGDRIRKEMELL